MSLFTVIPQGPFVSQATENNCPYRRVVGFRSFQAIHNHIGSGAGNPVTHTFDLDRDVGYHSKQHILNYCNYLSFVHLRWRLELEC